MKSSCRYQLPIVTSGVQQRDAAGRALALGQGLLHAVDPELPLVSLPSTNDRGDQVPAVGQAGAADAVDVVAVVVEAEEAVVEVEVVAAKLIGTSLLVPFQSIQNDTVVVLAELTRA